MIQGCTPILLLTDQEGAPAPSSRSALTRYAGHPRHDRSASLRGKIKKPALDNRDMQFIYDPDARLFLKVI